MYGIVYKADNAGYIPVTLAPWQLTLAPYQCILAQMYAGVCSCQK